MTGKLCFWAILSNTDLRFIYFSPSLAKLLGIPPNVVPDVLQGKTLWELIHPEEYALAREDLKKFMDNKHIGGSVTRCRLMDLDNIIEHKVVRQSSTDLDIPVNIQPRPLDKRPSLGNGPNWEVVDIVMYLVTDQFILTFFHADYDSGIPSHTGSLPLICQEVHFTMEDAKDLTHILHLATAEEAPNARPDSTRIFQIMETATQSILLTWPPASDKVRGTLQITDEKLTSMLSEGLQRKQNRQKDLKHLHPYEHATCVHQAQVHNHTLYDSGVPKKVDNIIVQYGSITFGSFDVSLLHQPLVTPPKAISDPLSTILQKSQSPPLPQLSSSSLDGHTIQPSPPSPRAISESRSSGNSIREADASTSRPEEIHTSESSFRPVSNTTVWNANIQLKLGTSSHGSARVICENCHTDSSPEWRKGPTGQKTLCNACGLRYARSVAKQDSFGRRQRGVRVIVNSNQYEKQAPAPPAMDNTSSTLFVQSEPNDELLATSDQDSQQSLESLVVPEQANSTSSASMTRRRKKSRYLPIGDNRAGARTRAARKARSIHSDTTPQQLTHDWSNNLIVNRHPFLLNHRSISAVCTMSSAYSTVVDLLSKLSITPKTVEHEPVADNKSWNAALDKIQAGVSYKLSKTLVLKPKTAKSAAPTPLVILALDSTETNITAISKSIGLKDCRFASEDLLKETFDEDKTSVSAFSLSNVKDLSLVHVVVDSDLLSLDATEFIAFHPAASDKTSFISSTDLKAYLDSLGKEYKVINFKELAAAAPAPAAKSAPKAAAKPAKPAAAAAPAEDIHQMGIEHKKNEDLPRWYQQVLTKSDMLDYYDVSGCYILRPLAYNIWKEIQNFFDAAITEMGVEDTYFPMFVSNRVLEKEKDHIEGFAPEVAWVTKAGKNDLEEPIAIRPTSETVMYPYFAKWIRSHRDLPLKINQWCSVVRWEFKNPQPFLRTREFLWQEGHTAHLNKAEADVEVRQILDLYEQVYNDYLALPVVKGVKSEKERFAGGLYTTTVEGFVPATGRAIQGGTSHALGQNFSKMFNIVVEDPNSPVSATEEAKKIHVWQNSWGLSTRTIGVMVMVHGDDKGLVLPPRVANTQVVIIPCGLTVKSEQEDYDTIYGACNDLAAKLKKAGFKCKTDLRDNYTPGYKFNHWEIRGVPLRVEIGPNDLKKEQVTAVRRDTGAKSAISLSNIENGIKETLDTIQHDMFVRAKAERDASIVRIDNWDDFVPNLNDKKLILMPWCDRTECEDDIKDRSSRSNDSEEEVDERAPSMGAKSLCRPYEQPTENPIVPGETKCAACGQDAKHFMLFGRSY